MIDKNNVSLGMKIIIVIFAVVLVLSLMLPFFSSCSFGGEQQAATDDSQAETAEENNVQTIDAAYEATVQSLEETFGGEGQELLLDVNMGKAYMEWGGALQAADDAADHEEHIQETFAKAVPHFESYLAKQDSNVVRVNKAACQYYAGNKDEGIAELEEFVAGNSQFSPAWEQLGMLYEAEGRYAEARSAYESAIEADQVESYNVAYLCEFRLAMLDLIEQAMSQATDASDASDSSAASDESALADSSAASDASAAADTVASTSDASDSLISDEDQDGMVGGGYVGDALDASDAADA